MKKPFNTGDPIADFLTWTTYGTWLPGDERGWQVRGEGGIKPANDFILEQAQANMKEDAFTMTDDNRVVVNDTIVRHCEIRNWTRHAVNVRTNHAHLVVTAHGYEPETVRDQIKAWCTRNLKPHHTGRKRFWTEGGSCQWINHEEDLEALDVYTNDAQDRKGLDE